MTQYIGEVCRYLLATPPVPEEKMHKVTKMFGNGLRFVSLHFYLRQNGQAKAEYQQCCGPGSRTFVWGLVGSGSKHGSDYFF